MRGFNESGERSRRTFVKEIAGLTGALAAAGGTASLFASTGVAETSAVVPVQPTVGRIGLQLYTIRDQMAADQERALETVARVGYKQVEFAGYNNRAPAQIRAQLDRLGLTAPSTHIGLGPLRTDFEGQVGLAQTLGHKFITVPSLGQDLPAPTVDAWRRLADEFNTLGTRLKARGIRIGFHNHREEFVPLPNGQTGMDIFVAQTDPDVMAFQLDLGWMTVAGQNPVQWFQKYPGRFQLWHVKDMGGLQRMQDQQMEAFRNPTPRPAAGQGQGQGAGAGQGAGQGQGQGAGAGQGAGQGQGQQARPAGQAAQAPAQPAIPNGPFPVGAGEIDFKPIFAAWRQSGVEHFFVEHDGAANWPGGSTSSIATSHRNIVNILT